MRPALAVALEGEFRSWSSLARVNRELGAALARDPQLDLTAIERAARPDPNVAPAPELVACMRTAAPGGAVHVRHRWPPDFTRPDGAAFVVCQPWEFGALPAAWRDGIAAAPVDAVWTYTRYVRDVYVRAGVAPERLTVVPLGIDPAVFRPDGPRAQLAARGTRLLYLGGSTPRKGIDVAVNAFLAEFGAGDDVTLVVKDASALYPGNNVGAQIARIAATSGVAHVLYLDGVVPDAELAAIYRACDALVAPYRGEGFGLPVLEAMACGLAPIVTAGGATDDFVDASVGLPIPATRRAFPHDDELPLVAEGWLLEPDLAAVRAAMRRAVTERAAMRALGAAAARRAAQWTWTRSAAIARDALLGIDPVRTREA